MHTYFMSMFKHYCRPMRVNIQSCVPINTSVVNIYRLTYGEPDLTCTSLLRCLMVSSFSLISSSTELFSLGVQQKRHEYLANKRKACRPGSPISSSQLSSLACRWTSTISSPWTIISLWDDNSTVQNCKIVCSYSRRVRPDTKWRVSEISGLRM